MEDCLPIVEVNDDNFIKLLPALRAAIRGASFVAIDCELTGIGDQRKLNCPEIDLRYQFTSEIARNYAVISLGLSCFTCRSVSDVHMTDKEGGEQIRSHDYLVQTFNVLTLCSESFRVDCGAIKFLLNHGFDFNNVYAKGLQYYRGCDQNKDEPPNVRQLFSTLLEHRKPVVLHNGLMDLAFLYQCFYAELPKKADTFAADLTDMFPCGIYDTKYIAEYHQSMPATYLEYLYKKMQLKNTQRGNKGEWHTRIQFPPYPKGLPNIDWQPYRQIHYYNAEKDDDGCELCETYAFHGWCSKNVKCDKSHNINKIVKLLQPKALKKRGGKYTGPKTGSLVSIIQQVAKREILETREMDDEVSIKKRRLSNELTRNKLEKRNMIPVVNDDSGQKMNEKHGANGHRAGYDAFMTGFIFATHVSEGNKLTAKNLTFTPENIGLSEQVNKVYLMGKNIPFLVRTGTYANMSTNHMLKIPKVRRDNVI
ncbi:target of EGR1 protein 1-like [Homarus americanus]|nr:target of EGR1 protein 1-like [Homarus americanus]